MKVIRIDNDVWKLLKEKAIPLEDNPNSVLRRLLGIDQRREKSPIRKQNRKKRLSPGSGRTDQKMFLQPILEVLRDLNGEASVSEIFKRLEVKMKQQLKSVDFEPLKSGQIRWKNTAQWARNELAAEGFLEKNIQRGIWQLSSKGKKHLEANASLVGR